MTIQKSEKCINSADRLKGFATLTNIYIKKESLQDTSRLIVLANKHPIINIPTLALKDHYYREFENHKTGAIYLEKISYPEGMVGIYLQDICPNLCFQGEDELEVNVEIEETRAFLMPHLIICEGRRIIPQFTE